jgi:hypothetical protein
MKENVLAEKGWSNEDLTHAGNIIDKKEHHDVHFSKIVFWSSLLVIIFANIIVSLVLIPFMIALNTLALYSTIILLAGSIGFLYNLLVRDIGHLERKHHRTAGIIVPLIGIANMFVMVLVSNNLILDTVIKPTNPWLVAGVFAISFILPYLVGEIKKSVK